MEAFNVEISTDDPNSDTSSYLRMCDLGGEDTEAFNKFLRSITQGNNHFWKKEDSGSYSKAIKVTDIIAAYHEFLLSRKTKC